MNRRVSEAFMEHPDGRRELVGTFSPFHSDGRPEMIVAERRPITRFIAGPPRAVEETIGTHTFPVVHMRDDRGARFVALRVKPGDPVDWLPGWTWRDPHMAARRRKP